MSKKNIKVLVAAHKKYWMPSDEMYLPLHVGHAIAKQEIGFQGMTAAKIYQQKCKLL